MGKNKNSDGGDIFGFFGALFLACMPEARNENKRNEGTKNNKEPASGVFQVIQNLGHAMTPSKKELSEARRDLGELKESRLYSNKGLASDLNKGSRYLTGHETPGFFSGILGFITDPVSPYALPLDDEKRINTVKNLTEYSKNSPSPTSLSLKAQEIAKNLQLTDTDGQYKFQSLAGAANEAGLSKENLIDLATIAQQDPRNLSSNDRNSQGESFNRPRVNGLNEPSRQSSFRYPDAVSRDQVSSTSSSLSDSHLPSYRFGGRLRVPRGGRPDGGGGSSR